MMTTFAVATPHALVLTVSHGCCFANPLICGGMNARRFSLVNVTSASRLKLSYKAHVLKPDDRSGGACTVARARLANHQQSSPHRRFRRGVANPSFCAAFTNTRCTDETSRSEFGDLACRPIRLWLSRLSFHLACAANLCRGPHLYEGHSWRSRRRGAVISGRFRERKLVASGRYSKCYFAAFLPRPNALRSCPFSLPFILTFTLTVFPVAFLARFPRHSLR